MSKRVSRSITFYPTPEDNELLEELDRRAAAQQIAFSELCKLALRQFVQGHPYSVTFGPGEKALQDRLETELAALGITFSEWVKRQLSQPADLEHRLRRLEQAVAELQQRPLPLTQADIEALIRQHVTRTPQPNQPPPPPPPATPDPLIAELGALLGDDF
ncbi:MAG: hypothetical protein Q6K95_10140 [Gloeomargarita sp. GXS_bins_116]